MFKIRYIILCFVIMTSCGGILTDAETLTIVNVEPIYHVELNQKLQEGHNPLEFKISTITEFNCEEAEIDLRSSTNNNKVQININEVKEPKNCVPVPGKVVTTIETDLEIGLYTVDFQLNTTIANEGHLVVENENYELFLSSHDGILIPQTLMQIIPDDIFWVTITDAPFQRIASVQNEFNNRFSYHGLEDGYYDYFTLVDQEVTFSKKEDEQNELASILYKNDGSRLILEEFKKQMEASYPTVTVAIFTGAGKI